MTILDNFKEKLKENFVKIVGKFQGSFKEILGNYEKTLKILRKILRKLKKR